MPGISLRIVLRIIYCKNVLKLIIYKSLSARVADVSRPSDLWKFKHSLNWTMLTFYVYASLSLIQDLPESWNLLWNTKISYNLNTPTLHNITHSYAFHFSYLTLWVPLTTCDPWPSRCSSVKNKCRNTIFCGNTVFSTFFYVYLVILIKNFIF